MNCTTCGKRLCRQGTRRKTTLCLSCRGKIHIREMLEKRDRYKIVEKRTGKVIKKFRLKNAMLAYWESLYMQELYEIVDSQPDSLRTKGGSNNEKG